MLKTRVTSASLVKKMLTSFVLVAIGVWAAASMGGGGSKSKEKSVKAEFTPIRTSNGFTLKAGPVYHGSTVFSQQKINNQISFNSIVSYQKGNTTYIIPSRYKVQLAPQNSSSLQLLNLKIKMHK